MEASKSSEGKYLDDPDGFGRGDGDVGGKERRGGGGGGLTQMLGNRGRRRDDDGEREVWGVDN